MGESAAKPPAEDPSMEDILASIRQILNDDAPAEAAPVLKAASAAAPPEDVFVLDRSMLIEEPAKIAPIVQVNAASITATPEAAAPEPAPPATRPAPAPAPPPPAHADPSGEPLLAPAAVAAATASMGALVRVLDQQQTPVYRGGPTLEDMVRDEIRPMVKSWLDEHLPPMVERMVRAEIARVTNGK